MRHFLSRRRLGMTLIELLIALLIAGIAATAVFALFVSQSRSMKQSQDAMEIHDNVRVALDAIARDLRSAGFMSGTTGVGLRVENNCGNKPTGQAGGTDNLGVHFDPALRALVAPSGTLSAVTANGDYVKTTQKDGCPNGSDRLTVSHRLATNYIRMTGSNPGNDNKVQFDCGAYPSCGAALKSFGVQGVCSGGGASAPTQLCAQNDPNRCYSVILEEDGGACPCDGTAACGLRVFDAVTGNPFNSVTGVWDPLLCPDPAAGCTKLQAKENASIGGWVTRSYQLLDLDGDGATELVSSNDQASFATRSGPAQPATFDVVANNIDDLQVAVAYRSEPDRFRSGNLWDFPRCTPSSAPPSVSGPENCLLPLVSTPDANNPPVAVRVSIVARSSKRRISGGGSVEASRRTKIEDNDPPFDPFDPAGVVTPGPAICYGGENCGCGGATAAHLITCSTTGNAQGYARRVVTETIALRNFREVPR